MFQMKNSDFKKCGYLKSFVKSSLVLIAETHYPSPNQHQCISIVAIFSERRNSVTHLCFPVRHHFTRLLLTKNYALSAKRFNSCHTTKIHL